MREAHKAGVPGFWQARHADLLAHACLVHLEQDMRASIRQQIRVFSDHLGTVLTIPRCSMSTTARQDWCSASYDSGIWDSYFSGSDEAHRMHHAVQSKIGHLGICLVRRYNEFHIRRLQGLQVTRNSFTSHNDKIQCVMLLAPNIVSACAGREAGMQICPADVYVARC